MFVRLLPVGLVTVQWASTVELGGSTVARDNPQQKCDTSLSVDIQSHTEREDRCDLNHQTFQEVRLLRVPNIY